MKRLLVGFGLGIIGGYIVAAGAVAGRKAIGVSDDVQLYTLDRCREEGARQAFEIVADHHLAALKEVRNGYAEILGSSVLP